LLAFGKIMSG